MSQAAAYLERLLSALIHLGGERWDSVLAWKLAGAGIFAGAITWGNAGTLAHEWIHAGPLFVVLCLWALDMLVGTVQALIRRDFSPTKSLFGVLKLLVWVGALGVAWLLRVDGYPLDDLFAPLVEYAVILTEASSVLRNLAELHERLTGKPSRVLRWFASRVEQATAEHLATNGARQNGVRE